MSIMYKSTRSNSDKVTASQAILKGLADDGGLFVPDSIPALEVPLEKLADMTYQETAYEVMKLFLSDFTEEELKHCINGAYDDKFDTKEIAPLVKKMVLIIWNCSMEKQSPLKIWHFQFSHI